MDTSEMIAIMEKLAERERRRSERLARMVILDDFSLEPVRTPRQTYDEMIVALDVRRIE